MKVSIKRIILYIIFLFQAATSMGQAQSVELDSLFTIERSIPQEKINDYRSQKEYNYELNPSYENNWLERFLIWLENNLVGAKQGAVGIGWVAKIVYWGLLLFALGALIYFILLSKGHNIFSRAEKSIAKIAANLVDENTSMGSIDELITSAEGNSNYMLAIRLHYLKALRLLDDNKYILWKSGKTNHDYISEIEDDSKRSKFYTLSYIYEYSWYGKFTILDESQYQQLKDPFVKYYNEII